MRTHYDILQVQERASPDVIKGAYRYLARKWHPDNHPDDRERALGILRVIKQAYLVLSDPDLRKKHDEWIAAQRATLAPAPLSEAAPESVPDLAPESAPESAALSVEPVAEARADGEALPAPAPAQGKTVEKAAARSAPFLLRLYRGDVPLVVTYWIFGVLIGIFVFNVLIINPLEAHYATLTLRYGDYFHSAIYAILFSLTAFFYLAIWNSAGKYRGPRYYAHLARFTVVASATFITLAFAGALTQVFDQTRDTATAGLNSTEPYMIDDDTRLDGTTISGNDVHHHYTLVRIDSTQFDARAFAAAMQPRLAAHACADGEVRKLLEQGGAISYNYANNAGRKLTQLKIKSSHCR